MIRFDTKEDMAHYDNLYHQIYEKNNKIAQLTNILTELEEYMKENEGMYILNAINKIQKLKEKYK